jgi:transcriptional regulator with XRE-family HTH domain
MMQKPLATKLRLLRAQRGLTVKDAAGQLGVDRHTLRRIELGTQEAQYPTLAKIAKGYGVPVKDLLEEPALAGKAEAPKTGPAVTPAVVDEPEEGLSPTKIYHDVLARERTPELLLEQLHEHGIRTNLSEASILGQIIGMSDELLEEDPVDHERIGWLLAAAALSGLLTQDERRAALQTAREWLAGEQTPAGY